MECAACLRNCIAGTDYRDYHMLNWTIGDWPSPSLSLGQLLFQHLGSDRLGSADSWVAVITRNTLLSMIHAAITRAQEVLENPALQGETQRHERNQQIWAAIKSYFDLPELSQRMLGIHWRERTPEERREFVSFFTALIEQTYSHALTQYTSDVQISFENELIEGNYTEVDTQARIPSLDKTISMQ